MTDTYGYTSDRLTSVTGGNPETFGYDTAGRMTSRGTSSFTWSPLDRMVTASVGGTSAAYGYDGDGYRVKSTVGAVTRYFVHDGSGRILAEYDGSGNLLIEHIYLGDRRIASRQADGTRSYVQHDLLGSSWIVTQSSNSGEYAIWDYWPFGEPVSQFDFQAAAPELAPEALCTAANPLFCDGFESGNLLAWTCTNGQGGCIEPDWELFEPLFTGKKQDAVTGLFYFEARFMDAKLGRFVSPDEGPFDLENPQTFNRYAYAANSPYRYVDPDGRKIVVQAHRVIGDNFHVSIRIEPENQARYANDQRFENADPATGARFATIGAGPDEGDGVLRVLRAESRLVGALNRDRDVHKRKNEQITLDLQGRDEDDVIAALFEAEANYQDNLRYEPWPEKLPNAYNSNSFVSGILQAVGLQAPSVKSNVPGYDRPVPAESFAAPQP